MVEHVHTGEGYENCAECKEKVHLERLKNNHHTLSNLERALKTYRDRNRVYGNNYKRFGAIMVALYPDGVTLSTVEEWNRFGIILQKISKLSRYVTDPHKGHMDSIHDDGVYSFMLEELDAEAAGLDADKPKDFYTATMTYADAYGKGISVEELRSQILPNPCEHVYEQKAFGLIPVWACIRCGEVK